jgi:glycosyltransferase involved in cell wall biosynthesis
MELISLITATHNRSHFLKKQYENICNQTWINWEWLIDDDSDEPDTFFEKITDDRVHYYRSNGLTIGTRRNQLIEKSKGEIIAIIDDDDYYTENYLKTLKEYLKDDIDFVKINGFYLYDYVENAFYYWDLTLNVGQFKMIGNGKNEYLYIDQAISPGSLDWGFGYSFAYMFKKNIYPKVKFSDKNFGDDTDFTKMATTVIKILGIQDKQGIVLHTLCGNNISYSFPQYEIPISILNIKFPNFINKI